MGWNFERPAGLNYTSNIAEEISSTVLKHFKDDYSFAEVSNSAIITVNSSYFGINQVKTRTTDPPGTIV